MESWAEKYRPNSLSEIIGNTKTISQLQNWAGSWGEKMIGNYDYEMTSKSERTLYLHLTPNPPIPDYAGVSLGVKWSHLSGQYSGFAKVYRV